MKNTNHKEFFKSIDAINAIMNCFKNRLSILPSHVILGLYNFYSNEFSSRYALSDYLAISEAKARKIFSVFESNNLIKPNLGRKGSKLSKKGEKFCDSLFLHIRVFNKEDIPFKLEDLTVGAYDFLIGIPLHLVVKNDLGLNPISVRDSAMKIGALGASIFHMYRSLDNEIQVKFYASKSQVAIETEYLIAEFRELKKIISGLETDPVEWLLIACSIGDKLPEFYFNPYFDRKKVTPLSIIRLAGFQAIWDLLH